MMILFNEKLKISRIDEFILRIYKVSMILCY